MAKVQHTCTGCVPIDASIIEVYAQLIGSTNSANAAAERAEYAAEHAIGKSPYIGENGDWWEWDDEQGVFIDTGVQAQGSIAVDTSMSSTSTNPVQNKVITAAVNEKQDALVSGTNIKTVNGESLLGSGNIIARDPNAVKYTEQTLADSQKAQARSNIGAGTYSKAGSGIPKSDLSSAVQTSLGKADTAIQDISGKQDVITDLATIRSGAAAGATAYQKPASGVPASDMASGVQTSLGKADTAYQKPSDGVPKTDLASSVQESLSQADEAYVRPYDSQSPNGMGYLVLDNGKTFASQVTATNTIYEIRYNFDLDNASVTIPAGCMLLFNGGSLENGTLTGNNTEIQGENDIFDDSIELAGSFSNKEFRVDWFKKVSVYDDTDRINKLTNNETSRGKTIVLSSATYYIGSSVITLLTGRKLMAEVSTALYDMRSNGGNIIELSNSQQGGKTFIERIIFDKNSKSGHALYCDFEADHIFIENCNFYGVISGYSAIMFDEYTSPLNGVNALFIEKCKASGVGSVVTVKEGGDNVTIRDNNFSSSGGNNIYWDGIYGTASLLVEHNALTGGGGEIIAISNVGTITIRDNQIEAYSAISTNSAITIGEITLRQPCRNLTIENNNINLMVSPLVAPACTSAIQIKYVYGGIIANNEVSFAVNLLYTTTEYSGIVVIDNTNGAYKSTTYPQTVVDPLLRVVVLDTSGGEIVLANTIPIFKNVQTSVKKAGSISQLTGNATRFVTYNQAIGATVDLNGFPTTRAGTTSVRTGSNLPVYLRYGADMVGFCYFDTTLGKPVWNKGWDGTKIVWVDATGQEV